MNIKVTEFDIEMLGREVSACSEAGVNDLYFKFENSPDMFLFSPGPAMELLIKLQSLWTSEVVHLSIDVEPYIKGKTWMES